MGVTGLWQVLQPCARPIKLETLNRKRLAVDASIWIYQFLKAVRDKEGNALRNSHVVGFFRRICKLLFFGIKPVFVFDGGAPILKRQTISGRKARREGRREDAVRTAGKLLAVQMQRRAEEEERRRKEEMERPARVNQEEQEEEIPDNVVYAEELQMTPQERKLNRTFKKKDAYHLPELDVSLSEMGAPNDPRIMSQEELEDYARQFHTGEDINLYDFSKIDFNSPFFQSLPPSDRYNILNAARLRSRLRMGYSKEQLDNMFPDRMAFSKFQIERVKERNELTQRLMNLNGMNDGDDFLNGSARVAGERGKEYVLVKNDGVEGGWALGVVSNRNEGQRSQPIDVDIPSSQPKAEEDLEEDTGFEDVPIEGLNRLPKQPLGRGHEIDALQSTEATKARQALYKQRRAAVGIENAPSPSSVEDDLDSLFLPREPALHEDDEDVDELFEDVLPPAPDEEDEELQRAIAMSLEQGEVSGDEDAANRAAMLNGPNINKPLDFNSKNAKAGRAFAHVSNSRALSSFASRVSENGPGYSPGIIEPIKGQDPKPALRTTKDEGTSATSESKSLGFAGPLPFESISLGKTFLRPKKKPANEGGFENEDEKEKAKPLPPWFSGDVREGVAAQKALDEQEFEGTDSEAPAPNYTQPILRKNPTQEVIDLDDPAPETGSAEVIDVESSDEELEDVVMDDFGQVNAQPSMGDVADLIRAEPPVSGSGDMGEEDGFVPVEQSKPNGVRITTPHVEPPSTGPETNVAQPALQNLKTVADQKTRKSPDEELLNNVDEEIEWSESDLGEDKSRPEKVSSLENAKDSTESPSPDFEDVQMQDPANDNKSPPPPLPQDDTFERATSEPALSDGGDYSDPEDEDLMRQLAVEAEEHARFASTLNAQSKLQSAEDYERELRQLRNQQKKDRRDADEVSHIMVTECQQLLKLFGLPYVTAPMEAEAQCAELVSLGLVDGIVTDDSDIFLFGGTRVYKNLFNQAKFVECYLSSDLEREYSLTREKIIQIAHLLGSDYTEGLPSIGPVTALEIVSEFADLHAFKDWWTEVQKGTQMPEDKNSSFRKKFKRNATKLFLPPSFPDARVDEAYLHPEVDSDPSPFQWGVPDLDALRAFLMATIGWSQERADEILVPVIRDMNRRELEGTQANITQFFTGTVGVGASASAGPRAASAGGAGNGEDGFAPRRRAEGKSKRMENALGRLHQQARNRTRGEDEGKDRTAEHDGKDIEAEKSTTNGKKAVTTRTAAAPRGKGRKRAKAGTREGVSSRSEREDGDEDENEDEDEDGSSDGAYAPASKKRGKRRRARK